MQKIVVILGPTAAGKTSMSLTLAKKFNGYIISADSRQIYRGMDIGTDKLTRNKWQGIKHRMIDIVNPDDDYSLAQYQKTVFAIINDQKKLLPFLVGGTGLYIQSIVDNLDIPKGGPDKVLRKELNEKTVQELFRMLIKIDPKTAQVIDENNKRRLIRAIEVCKTSGFKYSDRTKKNKPVVNALQIGVKISREEMYKKINKRVDEMMEEGLLDEAKKLGEKYDWDIPSMSAIGYKQLGLYFKKELSLDEAVELIKNDSRHYAKRQMTWFKRDSRINWVSSANEAEKLIERFL
ncbi:tRNA (adenosine(37)-N6)-dimethylallyltransferase MiaA [Patescibacteria group bacterium]|nr:tRNA (adenosine(37)-N6)-dimethylallyltransferase MiaA [Patescibacteria group bacterium]